MPVYKYQNLTYYIYITLTAFVSREKCIIFEVLLYFRPESETGPERFERILIGNDGIFTINFMSVNITIRR